MITARVGVISGGSVQFNFNSYAKIKNGITYVGHTKLKIYFNDDSGAPLFTPNPNAKGWTLYCKALNSEILSDEGFPSLPLNTLKVTPRVLLSSFPGSTVINDPGFFLSDVSDGVWIVRNITVGEYHALEATVELDFSFATSGSLMYVASGYYYLDLQFLIIPNL